MKQFKNKIISGVIIAIVLTFAFWYGGNAPGLREWNPQSPKTAVQTDVPMTLTEKIDIAEDFYENAQSLAEEQAASSQDTSSAKVKQSNEEYSQGQGMITDEDTGKDKYRTDPVPEGMPIPVEPENVTITKRALTCTLSVRCDTILNNIEWLDSEKLDIVPNDGVIYAEKTVIFYEGESVFDLLVREMEQSKIHMEFENTPIYNSAYIEGIANLYEFDCGELSGWMYKVNGWFPNYGCSRYQLKAGDKVEWVYTCDLGVDVGGYYATSGN